MIRLLSKYFFVFAFLLGATNAFAQPSGTDLATALEQKLNSGAAVKMKFAINGEKYTLLADLRGKGVRIDAGPTEIVTDGKTVWNYNRQAERVTIDDISNNKNSALKSPKDLFKFSTNYTTELISSHGSLYTLKFTPNDQIRAMLSSLGNMQSLTIELSKHGKKLTINHASIETSSGTSKTSTLSVTTVRSVSPNAFIFNAPNAAKVVDLRE